MLYKIARKKTKRTPNIDDVTVGLGVPNVVLGASSVGIIKGLKHASKNHPTLTTNHIKSIYRHVGGKKKLQFDHLWKEVKDPNTLKVDMFAYSPLRSAYYNKHVPGYKDKTPRVFFSKNTPDSIVAHEMGHSTSPFLNSKLGFRTYLGIDILPTHKCGGFWF